MPEVDAPPPVTREPVKGQSDSILKPVKPKLRTEVKEIIERTGFDEVKQGIQRRNLVEPLPGRNLKKEDEENTRDQLQLAEEDSGFLELDHPLVIELQRVLDQMQDPNSRRTRLLIALNETESNAYCLPDDTIVLNMALIHDMDYIEEVIAILAHEQTHSEKGHRKKEPDDYEDPNQPKTLKTTLNRWLKSLGHMRKAEYQADFGTLSKLDRLGYDSMAFASAVRKIGRRNKNRSAEDEDEGISFSHGSEVDRALNTLYAHAIVDFPSSAQGQESWHAIPAEWKIAYQPSITERLRKTENMQEWWGLVNQATPLVLTTHIQELVSELYEDCYYPPRDKTKRLKSDHVNKISLVFKILEKRLEAAGLSQTEKRRAMLLGLTEATGISPELWLVLYGYIEPGKRKAIAGPITFNAKGARAEQINIGKFLDFSDKTPEGVSAILDLHSRKEIYLMLGLKIPTSDFPSSLLNNLWNGYSMVDKRRKIEGFLPEGVIASLDNLLKIEVVISEIFDKEKGTQWLDRQIKILIYEYITQNNSVDGFFGFSTKLFADKVAQFLLHIRDNTDFVFKMSDLDNYAYQIANQDRKEHQWVLNLLRDVVYRPDSELESIVASQNSEKLLEYIRKSPEKFTREFALLCNKRTLIGPQRRWFTTNLSPYTLAQIGFSNEVNIVPEIAEVVSGLPFDNEIENYTPEQIQTFNRLFFGLENIVILTAGQPIELRQQEIERFFAAGNIEVALESLPLALNYCLAQYVSAELTEGSVWGDETFIAIRSENKLDMLFPDWKHDEKTGRIVTDYVAWGDRLLGFAPSRVLRAKLERGLAGVEDLRGIAEVHSFISKTVSAVYQTRSDSIWGFSADSARVLSPFLTKLFDKLSSISIESSSAEESMLAYSTFREEIPQDIYNKGLIDKLLNHQVLKLPFEDALVLLEQEAVKRRLDFKTVELFVNGRISTREDYLRCRDTVSRIVDRIMEQDESDEGKLVAMDVIGNDIMYRVNSLDLLKAVMRSSEDDSNFRRYIAPSWWYSMAGSRVRIPLGVVDTGELRGWEVLIEGRTARLVGPAAYGFQPFNDVVSRLYRMSGIEKNMFLRKLFLAKYHGILMEPRYQSKLAGTITSGLRYDRKLTPLFQKVINSAVKACDPIKIFHPLSGSLSEMILNPFLGQVDNGEAAKELHSVIHKREGGGKVSKAISYAGFGVTVEGVRAMLDLSRNEIAQDLLQGMEPTRAAYHAYEQMLDGVARQVGYSEQSVVVRKPTTETSPIEIVMQVGQAMGPVGKRFLQVLGQYIELDPEYQEKFREVYDSNPGQSKYTAFSTIERLAKTDEETRVFLEDELVSIDEKLGGGSIMTTFKITTRDASGKLKHEVLKIKNPNAERFVLETVEQANLAIENLITSDPANSSNYEIARRLLATIKEWVLADINDLKFIKQDEIFAALHEDFTTSEGVKVHIPEARKPHNLYLKREELIPGETINLLTSEIDTTEGKIKFRRAVRAEAELFARSLTIPALDADSDIPKYLVRSDIHPGNDIVSERGDILYPIDRNYYLVLEQADVDFFKTVVSEIAPQDKLQVIVRYALNQPENRNLGLNPDNTVRQIARALLSVHVLNKLRGNGSSNGTLQLANKVLHELDKRGIQMPLRTRLLFKNLDSVNHMLKQAELGSFSQYLA